MEDYDLTVRVTAFYLRPHPSVVGDLVTDLKAHVERLEKQRRVVAGLLSTMHPDLRSKNFEEVIKWIEEQSR